MKKKIATLIGLIGILGLVGWGIYALVMAPRHAVQVSHDGFIR